MHEDFRREIIRLLDQWETKGFPSREGLERAADNLRSWRENAGLSGLWSDPPMMVTATIDDGLGQGLAIIHKFAVAVGLIVHPIGLMQEPDVIIDVCRSIRPALLGLTILQFDSEEAIAYIADQLPTQTTIIAGGSVFAADPEFAGRTGIHFVADHVGDFLEYLLYGFPPMG